MIKCLNSLLVFILVVVLFTALTSKIPILGIRSFVVSSGSMQPALPVGSVLFIRPALIYSVGDIISFKNSSGSVVTHRIVGKSIQTPENIYRVAGDANPQPDSALISQSEIICRSFSHLPVLGRVAGFTQSRLGFLTLLLIPTFLFITRQTVEIICEIQKVRAAI